MKERECDSNIAWKVLHTNLASTFPSFPSVANFPARHSNLPFGRLASMPFWSHPNVLEFTLKAARSPGGGQEVSVREIGGCEIVIYGGTTPEQRGNSRVKWWQEKGCGIVGRRRFTMMVASPVKANVALPFQPPAATCIP